ncbi:MAG TPA: carboxypeptidase-like regulatory domain-containing protein, partial [Flavobacteriales bacterium]|nr:carboxypeptidase-like regulatory domain-containing protein [Flavobacteriales bacterium]
TTSFVYAQNTGELLTGTITDSETKEPLIGASVVIKGNSKGTTTDANGKFVLSNSVGFPVRIIVSYIGYHSQEIEAKVPGENLDIKLKSNNTLIDEITISARRREENAQDVPIPISVVSGAQIEESGAFNVNRIKELVPSVQLYSSNPRNTTLNIRGMGSTFGLTNDGIDPGVGFYVDGVYYARPAATALDFVDVDRIEVLRGPQGTLFGKNTTAGAFNITSRAASFTPGATYELSYGNYGFVQAKGSVTGPLSKKTALRISFSGTQRDGLIKNIATNSDVNDLNNLGVRTQLLYRVNDNLKITWFADFNRQRPDGYAQVVAGVVTTKRAAYRQFNTIIADLGYSLPTTNPYDRIIDHNTPWKSTNDLGGTSLNIDAKIGKGTLTSTTAWRHWYWGPSNDRDFTGLSVLS